LALAASGTAIAAATASGKSAFTTAAASIHGVKTSTLPATHSSAIAASMRPPGVGRPVQLRTAVRRKPATTAMV
jgi:hypothetical protein